MIGALLLAAKVASLFMLLWWGTVTMMLFAKSQSIPMLNFVIASASAVAFVWSMGWLS